MLETKDIQKLAKLARIDLTDAEMQKFSKDVDPILNYIAQIKEVSGDLSEQKAGEHRNVTRDDLIKNNTGENSADIISNFPEKDDGYLKVKKIL